MKQRGLLARSLLVAGVVIISGSMAGCGGSDGTSSAQATTGDSQVSSAATGGIAGGTTDAVMKSALTVTGTPAPTATAGQAYSFKPQVSGAAAASFTASNLPSWAKLDATTGQISGTPAAGQVGQYAGIVLTATSGTKSASLPAFSITVAAATAVNAVTLSWDPPTENADGSQLVDLKGYKIHYGTASKNYSDTVDLNNPGMASYVIPDLSAGNYYFAITAYNSAGEESALSPEVSTMVN